MRCASAFRTKRWPYSWSSKVVENQYFTGVYGRYIMIYHDTATPSTATWRQHQIQKNYPCLGEGLLVCWVYRKNTVIFPRNMVMNHGNFWGAENHMGGILGYP
jgi:hypothetical protein